MQGMCNNGQRVAKAYQQIYPSAICCVPWDKECLMNVGAFFVADSQVPILV